MKILFSAWFIAILLFATTLAEESAVDSGEGNENTNTGPVVTLRQGKLQGLTYESRKGNKYYAFLGVKYGKVPIRFGPPQAPDSWEGTKKVTKLAPHCFQFCLSAERLVGVEDCLTANIFTPNLSTDVKLPVMVLLHGGGFQFGSGSLTDAKYLVDANVVVVTIQYRLGALGFLNTGDDSVTGNGGLRDQSFALKWIQENIDKFGGDKTKVTIFGYSAGGASVHYHLLSPMSKGLFSNGISFSGSALCPWAFQKKPLELTQRLAENVGCTTKGTAEMVECLRGKTPAEIVTGQLKLGKFPHDFDLISMLFSPSVEEGNIEPKFLADTPYKLIVNGKTANKVPWTVGVTNDEGAFYTANILENEKSLALINSNWHKMAPNILYYENSATPATQSRISTKLWEFYFGDRKIGKDTYRELGRVYGDRFFVAGVTRAIKEHARKPDFPIYPYIFNYTGTHSIVQGMLYTKDAYGIAHADDLKYIFNKTFGAPEYDLTTTEGQFSEKYIELLVSFVKDGKPTPTWGSVKTLEPFTLAIDDDQKESPIRWYVIDEDTKISSEDPFKERTDFWESLPLLELEKEDYPDEKDEL